MLDLLQLLVLLRRLKITHDLHHEDFIPFIDHQIRETEKKIDEYEKGLEDQYLKCKNLK